MPPLTLPSALRVLRRRVLKLLTLWRLYLLGETRHGARNSVWVVVDVQTLIDAGRDGLDLGSKISFDVVEVEAVVPVDEVDGQTEMSVPAGATNTVKISFGILGEVKVNNDVDGLDVDTSGQKI